jgi:hypothetical protein
VIDLDPFDYSTDTGIGAWVTHLAGTEDQLRLLHATDGMLTGGDMPEYLFSRTNGIVGLLRRLIADGCAQAMATGEEQLSIAGLSKVNIRLGNFPDRDPGAGEVPEIPAAPVLENPPKPTGKRPRNTVFDDHGDQAAGE